MARCRSKVFRSHVLIFTVQTCQIRPRLSQCFGIGEPPHGLAQQASERVERVQSCGSCAGSTSLLPHLGSWRVNDTALAPARNLLINSAHTHSHLWTDSHQLQHQAFITAEMHWTNWSRAQGCSFLASFFIIVTISNPFRSVVACKVADSATRTLRQRGQTGRCRRFA